MNFHCFLRIQGLHELCIVVAVYTAESGHGEHVFVKEITSLHETGLGGEEITFGLLFNLATLLKLLLFLLHELLHFLLLFFSRSVNPHLHGHAHSHVPILLVWRSHTLS